MNIHEYQAKALLHEFGVPISKGAPVLRAADSDAAAKTLPGPIWVVKSQIHAGGRGKGKFKDASAGDKVAHSTPEKIVTFSVDPATGIMGHHGRTVAKALNLSGDLAKQAEKLVTQLYTAFVAKDMAMLEINPLVVTKQGELRVLDAKVSFDDNALFRHPEVAALRDVTEEDEKEIEASKYDLNYVTLDGNIGCMVNGAGLAMATMDIIKLYGMSPANFLDVGGGASKEKVAAAFKIITADPNVKGILVNIFGGIMKCDIIAEGVVAAVKEVGLKVPLVVRLEGTNVEAGKKIIRESGLNVLPADNLDDAAQKIVKAVKGG
jgi:succinyl-CoA synthetase beta subunit